MSRFDVAYATGPNNQSAAFLFCDHANNTIPDEFASLGLPNELLQDHIAFDPGASALTEALAQKLQARALFCSFSRLLIDPNRGVERGDLIVTTSDTIKIPGNQNLSVQEKQYRLQTYFHPYHQRLSKELDELILHQPDPFVISIHSFSQKIRSSTQSRPWEVGLLWRDDEKSARLVMDHLKKNHMTVGDNQPYSAKLYNYSVDRHIGPRSLRHITLEVRQDLLVDEKAITHMRDLLFAPLQALIENQ